MRSTAKKPPSSSPQQLSLGAFKAKADENSSRQLEEAPDLASFKQSSFFSRTIAMHLWWADNEGLVRDSNPTATEIKQLLPTAAVLFKDQPEEVKQVGL